MKSAFEGTAARVDLAYADSKGSGFATNIVVIRETPRGDVDLENVMKTFIPQAEAQATGAGVSHVEDRELAGVPAKTYAFVRRGANNVRQRQVVAVKDGAVYTITWSVAADRFEAEEATLDRILASWRWA